MPANKLTPEERERLLTLQQEGNVKEARRFAELHGVSRHYGAILERRTRVPRPTKRKGSCNVRDA